MGIKRRAENSGAMELPVLMHRGNTVGLKSEVSDDGEAGWVGREERIQADLLNCKHALVV
jgi:hypothetical protein